MPTISAVDQSIVTTFKGLTDLRPQVENVSFPFFDITPIDLVKSLEFLEKEGEFWEFGDCSKDVLTGIDIDKYIHYWYNDDVFIAVVYDKDLYITDKGDNLASFTIYQSEEYKGIGYIAAADLDVQKEADFQSKVNRIENYKTKFSNPEHQKIVDRIIKYNTNEDKIQQLETNVTRIESEIPSKESIETADAQAKAEKDPLVKMTLKTGAEALKKARQLKEAEIKMKKGEIAGLTGENKKLNITNARAEIANLYKLDNRNTALKRLSGPYKYKYAKTPKPATLQLNDNVITINTQAGRSDLAMDTERIVSIEHVAVTDAMDVSLSIHKLSDQQALLNHNFKLDDKDESRLKKWSTKNKIVWPLSGSLRGLPIDIDIAASFKTSRDPKKLRSEGGTVYNVQKLLRIQIPASGEEEAYFSRVTDKSNTNQIKFKGALLGNTPNKNNWHTEQEQCLHLVKAEAGVPLVQKAIDFAYKSSPMGFKPPKSIGKCARYTHYYAANYISMLLGFAPNLQSCANKGEMLKAQTANLNSAKEKLDKTSKEYKKASEKFEKIETDYNKQEHIATATGNLPISEKDKKNAQAIIDKLQDMQLKVKNARLEMDNYAKELKAAENLKLEESALLEQYQALPEGINTYPAGGNACDLSYHCELLAMGYAMEDMGRHKRSDLAQKLGSLAFKEADVLVYWCDDLYIDVITPLSKRSEISGAKTYGHTCIYSAKSGSKAWVSDFEHSSFVYSSGEYYRCIWFHAPLKNNLLS